MLGPSQWSRYNEHQPRPCMGPSFKDARHSFLETAVQSLGKPTEETHVRYGLFISLINQYLIFI